MRNDVLVDREGSSPENCIFCQIIRGEQPADFVFQGDSVVAFRDMKPHAPVHILLVPKKHIRSVNDISEADREVISELFLTARLLARKFGIDQSGYKLVFNVERGGGQFVFHLHLHMLGGW
jgi:histidine triad (HIT) family protein